MSPQHRANVNTQTKAARRRGATAPFLALLIVPLVGMVAFAIDYGYLTVVRSDLQRTADAAALASVVELIPADNGSQSTTAAKARLREYVAKNLGVADDDIGGTFQVLDSDIEIGRYDPTTIYSGNVQLFSNGIYDTVRVTLRRDNQVNSPVHLFFANAIGIGQQPIQVTATAVLRRGIGVKPKADVLPFAVHINTWDSLPKNAPFNIYDDNKVRLNDGTVVPGNWGTVDLGYLNNSTSDLNGMILNGIRQADVTQLYLEGRIPTDTQVRAPVYVQAETGMSSGMKSAVRSIYGERRIIPLFDSINGDFGGSGNNAEFHVVKWGVVDILGSEWNGANKTYIEATKAWTYDGALVPAQDLTDKQGNIQGAFTSPVLVE